VISNEPSGTYVATFFGMEQSLTFTGDTLEIYDDFEGKRVFNYKISEDGSKIRLINVASGKTFIQSFNFVKEHQVVSLNQIEYHRR